MRQSDINAYAWATLAAENGEARGRVLADELRPLLAPGSEKIANDIIAPFKPAELDARLMPILADDAGAEARCGAFKSPHVDYPLDAQDRGVEGSVFVSYVAMPDGSARSPRILYALPVGVFDGTVRRAILHTRFPAVDSGAKPIHCNVLYRFANGRAAGNSSLDAFIRMTRTSAEQGDGQAQFLYGMMVMGLPELNRKQSEAIPWFVKSAQQGLRNAQYLVGSSLLIGMGCQCQESKAEVWLREAAQADQPDAQVTLAAYSLRGDPDAAATHRALVWLERAAASGHHGGMFYLAGLLAASPIDGVRNPKRSLTLVDSVRDDWRGDPVGREIRAAALAASGRYVDAVKEEQEAISLAKGLQWDLSPLNERLASYEKHQPWFGNLLVL